MRRFLTLFLTLLVCTLASVAQNVNINSTGGLPFGTYPTLSTAFGAINNGSHTGQILVTVAASTTEGTTQAVLEASGTGAANYTKVYVTPTAAGLTITGSPVAGQAVIKLNGADNVTFNGTVNGGSGGTRDLSIINQNATPVTNTAAIWVASLGTGLGATGDTLMNLNVRGVSPSNSFTSFGIYAAGTTITSTGTGNDNDALTIRNNAVDRAYTGGIYVRGSSTGLNDNLRIQNNIVGSNNSTEYVINRGIDVQNANGADISGNQVFNMKHALSLSNAAIEVGGSSVACSIRRNRIWGIYSESTGGWGAYGINLLGGNNHSVVNNMIYDIRTVRYVSSTTFNAFGIRIASGTGHTIHYNSVNLSGLITLGANTGTISAAFLVTTTGATGLNVQNNVFQNKQEFGGASTAYAVYFPSGYNFASGTFNRNVYAVPATNTVNTTYAVGFNGSPQTTVANWRTVTAQDVNSLPNANQLVNFVSDNDLHIAGAPTIVESGGINITGITTDYDGTIRQGNVGYSHVPAGTAPDIGCHEFASVPVDFTPPTVSNVTVTPGSNCTAVSHTVTANITDGTGVGSATIQWTLNGVAQAPINMTNTSGSTWSGVIPASGSNAITFFVRGVDSSPQSNAGVSGSQSYQDAYLSVSVGPDVSFCNGGSATLNAVTGYGPGIKITEVVQFRTGTGATNPYPVWVPTGPDDYCEISNLGPIAVNLNGYNLQVLGVTTPHNLTFGNVVINPGQVIVVGLGTGTDDPVNGYYVTGEPSGQLSSSSLVGYVLKNPSGAVVDAVGTNNYSFAPTTGVTAMDWSGTIPSISGLAGATRIVSDNNTAADWQGSSTLSPQTIGSLNPGLSMTASPTVSWSNGATTGSITVSPSTATTYIATVTDGICTSMDTVLVNVVPQPVAPTVLNDTICGIGSYSLTATSGDTIRWFTGSTGGSPIFTGPTYTGSTNVTQNYYVEAWNGTCPSAPRTLISAFVQAPDTAIIGLSGDTLCLGDILTIVGSSNNVNYTYSWVGDSLMGTTGDTVMANPGLGSTQYNMVATDGFCTYTDSVEVFVLPIPMTTAATNAPPTPICIGDTVMLYGSAFAGTPVVNVSGSPGMLILDPPAVAQTTTLTVSGMNQISMLPTTLDEVCIDITHTWDSDMDITLISPQGTTFDLSSANGGSGDNYSQTCFRMNAVTNITAGVAPFTGTYIPEGAGGFAAFTGENPNGVWTISIIDNFNGDQGTLNFWSLSFLDTVSVSVEWADSNLIANTDTILVTPNTTTTYFYTATNNFTGCSSTEMITVNVNPPLGVAINGPTGVCPGTTVNLTSAVTGGNGAYTYLWDGTGTTSSYSVTVNSPTTVILQVMDSCSTPAGFDTLVITPFAPVSGTLTGPTTVCEGAATTLTANPIDGDGNYTFNWSNGIGAAGSTVTVNPTANTTYSVTITDGCGTSTTQTLAVTVNPLASASFTWAQTGNNTITFTNTSTNGTSYSWNFGDTQTSTQMSPSHTYTTNGTYTVTLIVVNSCGADTITQTVDVLLAVSDFMGKGQVSVYPNPNDGQFKVRFMNLEGTDLEVTIFDVRGEQVFHQALAVQGQVMDTPINLTGLSKGMYFLQVTSGSDRQMLKVTVE